MPSHSARLSPLQPTTEWSLDDGVLSERRGRRLRRFPLSRLKHLEVIARPARSVRLVFSPLSAVIIPCDAVMGLGRRTPGAITFEPLLAALLAQAQTAAPKARLRPTPPGPAAAVLAISAMLSLVALLFAILSTGLGAAGFGLDIGARMLFAALLLLSLHPWLTRCAPSG
jgi:hypothetical protein